MATKGMTVLRSNGEDFTINDPNVANEFSAITEYAAGEHVTYQGDLYVFIVNHPAGAWNTNHVSPIKIGKEIYDLKNDFAQNGIIGDRSVFYIEPGILLSDGKWSTPLGSHAVFPVNAGDSIRCKAANNTSAYIAFLTAYNPLPTNNEEAQFSSSYTSRIVFYSTEREYTVPNDCKYVIISNRNADNEDIYPVEFSINGIDYACNIRKKLNDLSKEFVESANFNTDYISIGADGYIYLNHNTGMTHTNFVRCKSNLDEIGSVVFPYYISAAYPICRVFFENPNGSVLRCQIDSRGDGGNTYIQIANYLDSTYVGGVQSTVLARDAGYHELRITKIGRSLFYYVDDIYIGYNTLNEAIAEKVKICGVAFRGDTTNNSRYGKPIVYPPIKTFAHMSIDDRIACLADITTNAGTYTSIFDNAELAVYKELHEKYGCKFTLELFRQDAQTNPTFSISQTTTAFKNEFVENSSWLKFAYHGPDPETYISTMSTSDLISDIQSVYSAITSFAGAGSIDYCPRLSFFNCTHEQAIALKAANLICGLLSADDTRSSNVGLDSTEILAVQNNDYYTDYYNNITYYRTETRIESRAAVENIISLYNSPQNNHTFIIFAHDVTSTTQKQYFEDVAEYLMNMGILYDYPEFHLGY